jgi:iron complex outermembrane receptor protein
MKVVIVDSMAQGSEPSEVRHRSPKPTLRSMRGSRNVRSILGVAGVLLIAAGASAQEQPAADPEPAPAEPAPADPASPPAAEEAAPEAAATAEPGAEPLPEDVPMDVDQAPVSGELGEVVVTVDRRKKDLQDYSGTAASFSEKQLSRVGITSVSGLSSAIPGLQIGEQEGNTEVYIRGVGNDNNSEHGDMGVALHLDGVYLPRPRGVGAMFYDIERVEVNSGPQGTLRGRNAQGGSVNIITNKPKLGEFGANAEATFGTFAERRYQGMVNIPIGDALAFRFAGFSSVHDPHWVNASPLYDIKGPQAEDAYAWRAQVKWQPAPVFSVVAGYDIVKERGTSYVGANFDPLFRRENENGTPGNQMDDLLHPVDPESVDNPRRVFQTGFQPSEDMTHWGARLEATLDLGPAIIEALGSYRDLTYKQVTGSSAGVVDDAFPYEDAQEDQWGSAFWDSRSQAWMGELRAYAPDTARLRWTVGGFMLFEDQQVVLAQVSDRSNGYGGGEFNMPDVNGDSEAIYADATFDVTEAFRVLGGIRATHETKGRHNGLAIGLSNWPSPGGDGVRYGTEGYRPSFFDRDLYALPAGGSSVQERVDLFLDGVGSFGARDTIPQYLCADPPAASAGQEQEPRVALNADGHFRCTHGVNPNLGTGPNAFGINAVPQNAEVSNTFIDWRGGGELDLAKDNLLYATVSTAHKAAGYNDTVLRADGGQPYNTFYDPENVISFEVGSKNVFFDRKLKLNGAFFFYIYNNQVFQQIVEISEDTDPNPLVSTAQATSIRQNSGADSNIYGLDLDITYALPAGLQADVHVLLMDARFSDGTRVNDGRIGYDLPNGGQYPVDIGGKWLPRASALTINYALSQMIFTPAGSFNWIVDAQTRSKHYMTVFNGEGNLLPTLGVEPTTSQSYNQLLVAGDPTAYCYPRCGSARLTDVIPAYTNVNLGAGWTHPDGRLSISGYVNNAFNIAYATSIISTPNLNLRFFNPPRTAGVRVRVDW